jgi:hypothetical protein
MSTAGVPQVLLHSPVFALSDRGHLLALPLRCPKMSDLVMGATPPQEQVGNLSESTANSRNSCARLPREWFQLSSGLFAPSYRSSAINDPLALEQAKHPTITLPLGNAPTTSGMPAMFPCPMVHVTARSAATRSSISTCFLVPELKRLGVQRIIIYDSNISNPLLTGYHVLAGHKESNARTANRPRVRGIRLQCRGAALHSRGVRRQQHGLGLDPSLELFL